MHVVSGIRIIVRVVEVGDIFTIKTVVPVGMTGLLEKIETASGRKWESIPVSVKEHFELAKNAFKSQQFTVTVSFSDTSKYEELHHLYCKECEPANLMRIWEDHNNNLPEEKSIVVLMENWDRLGMSWFQNDILGCLIPNVPEETVVINAQRFLLKPEKHYNQFHAIATLKKEKRHTTVPLDTTFFEKKSAKEKEMSATSSATSSKTATASKTASPKTGVSVPKQVCFMDIRNFTSEISRNESPKNDLQPWAFGSVFKTVQQSANKCLSNTAAVENYKLTHEMVNDYHLVLTKSTKELSKVPPPPMVTLNDHNIVKVQKALLETYHNNNKDPDNPYRALEKCSDFGLLHNATSHWYKEINTIFLRVAADDGQILKVPFSAKRVPGSFTGEALCQELITEISKIKKVEPNATKQIPPALLEYHGSAASTPEQRYKRIHQKLKDNAEKADLVEAKDEMETILLENPHLKDANLDRITLLENRQIDSFSLPSFPAIFNICTLIRIENDTIVLSVIPEFIPTTNCGDSCGVNLKGVRLLEEQYDIKFPLSKCSSHIASGTIRRLCTSKTLCHPDAVSLYDNLRVLLKHFNHSCKNSDLLSTAIDNLEMHNVHLLNWGSTRMVWFP